MQKAIKITSALNILNVEPGVSQSEIQESANRLLEEYSQDNLTCFYLREIVTKALDSLAGYSGFRPSDYKKEERLLDKYNQALKEVERLELSVELCGSWIWLTSDFKSKAISSSLRSAGFKYQSKKRTFFFCPDYPKTRSRGSFSRDDIRNAYGAWSTQNSWQDIEVELDEEDDELPGEEVIEDEEE